MMRFLVLAALAWVALGAQPAPSVASPPTVERWSAPDGVFSVEIPNGWVSLDRAEYPDRFQANMLFLAVPAGTEQPESLCYVVLDSSMPAPGPASRARMNDATRQLQHSPTIEQMRADPNFRIDRVESDEIDGVATLDIYAQFGPLDTVQRRFFLHHNQRISMYTLSCSPMRSDQAAVVAARRLVASLRFGSVV